MGLFFGMEKVQWDFVEQSHATILRSASKDSVSLNDSNFFPKVSGYSSTTLGLN